MNEDFQASWSEPATMQGTGDAASSVGNSGGNSSANSSGNSNGGSGASTRANVAPQKQIVTIRLDVEMLKWFKTAGPGYQTRINQILRDHMEAHKADPAQA